ncbi:AlbA family DNA-binding domain-containing protein [Luteolibacter marinus]|uniref:AlbA family DNA-binding domain-containing protein n=1 Tax=Luteolibacter marinus TaxID=2776705 RepID=UPI00186967E7|nr:hypothetical protein [Luteolibacter marinus]
MTVHDSTTLCALIRAYEKAVVFEESVPNAFRVAKAFSTMRWSRGGLLLLGVANDGRVKGIDPGDIDAIFERFERLCGESSEARVEIGTLTVGQKTVVFLVFNTIARHVDPLERYANCVGRVGYF